MKKEETVSNEAAVTEAAEELARALRGSAEWQAYSLAQTAADQDTQLAKWMTRYRHLNSTAWSDQRGAGLAELAELRDHITSNAHYREAQEAGASLVELLRNVNKALSAGLGMDFAANAAPRSGCCG